MNPTDQIAQDIKRQRQRLLKAMESSLIVMRGHLILIELKCSDELLVYIQAVEWPFGIFQIRQLYIQCSS